MMTTTTNEAQQPTRQIQTAYGKLIATGHDIVNISLDGLLTINGVEYHATYYVENTPQGIEFNSTYLRRKGPYGFYTTDGVTDNARKKARDLIEKEAQSVFANEAFVAECHAYSINWRMVSQERKVKELEAKLQEAKERLAELQGHLQTQVLFCNEKNSYAFSSSSSPCVRPYGHDGKHLRDN